MKNTQVLEINLKGSVGTGKVIIAHAIKKYLTRALDLDVSIDNKALSEYDFNETELNDELVSLSSRNILKDRVSVKISITQPVIKMSDFIPPTIESMVQSINSDKLKEKKIIYIPSIFDSFKITMQQAMVAELIFQKASGSTDLYFIHKNRYGSRNDKILTEDQIRDLLNRYM